MTEKIHIYFVPGLAASSKIFEYIKLPEEKYELHFLEWLIPESVHEPIESYAKRFSELIQHKNAVLVGVSFGGMMIQEMYQYVNPKKLIVISSIKNLSEKPKRFIFLQKTGAYKLFPSNKISKIENFSTFGINNKLKSKLALYNKYLAVRDKTYLDWAVYHVLNWKNKKKVNNIVHIHGNKDEVFPIKHIKDSIVIEGGTHAMIIVKAKKINKILEDII